MAEQSAGVLLRACGVSHVGMVRTNNEDSYLIADLETDQRLEGILGEPRPVASRGALLAVSDGMGGAAAGEIASAITVESLRQWFFEDHGPVEAGQLMQGAVEIANRNVFDAAQEGGRRGMGATLTAVLIRDAKAHIAEVGDSRAYLMRAGRLRQVTRDQSFVEFMVEQGMMSREQAEQSPYRNVILQAMGQRPDVSVALAQLELYRGDVFVLCSDGLSGKLRDEEIRDILLTSPAYDEACRRLVAAANERGGEDNITVVIGEVTGEGVPENRHERSITHSLGPVQEFDFKSAAQNAAAQPAAAAPAVAATPATPAAHVGGPSTEPKHVAQQAPPLPPTVTPGDITQILTAPAGALVEESASVETPVAPRSGRTRVMVLLTILILAALGLFVVLFLLPRLG